MSNNIDSLKTIRIQCIEIRFIQEKSIQEKWNRFWITVGNKKKYKILKYSNIKGQKKKKK